MSDATNPQASVGDKLLALLGRRCDDDAVQAALRDFARGMQPDLSAAGEGSAYIDWVTVNEIGLEFGFQDEAYLRAHRPEARLAGPSILSQLYFYGDTVATQAFPHPLPFGLTWADSRGTVRSKMARVAGDCREYLRDAWALIGLHVTASYAKDSQHLESLYCHVPCSPWPEGMGERDRVSGFTPAFFVERFGQRWSSRHLREAFSALGYADVLGDVRAMRAADLKREHGIELHFAPGRSLRSSSAQFPDSLAFAGVTYYSKRLFDAREWSGPLPHDLSFGMSQRDLPLRLGRNPDVQRDRDRIGLARWHYEQCTLQIEYSNIENRILRICLAVPDYWSDADTPESAGSSSV